MKPMKSCISLSEKMAFSHRSLISNKPCWVREGKGWFDHSLPTADELKESIFQRMSADSIGVLSTIIENHDEPSWVSHYIAEGPVNDTSKKP